MRNGSLSSSQTEGGRRLPRGQARNAIASPRGLGGRNRLLRGRSPGTEDFDFARANLLLCRRGCWSCTPERPIAQDDNRAGSSPSARPSWRSTTDNPPDKFDVARHVALFISDLDSGARTRLSSLRTPVITATLCRPWIANSCASRGTRLADDITARNCRPGDRSASKSSYPSPDERRPMQVRERLGRLRVKTSE